MALTLTCPCCEDDITLATQPDDESFITCPECDSLLIYLEESNSFQAVEDCYAEEEPDEEEDDADTDDEDVD